MGYRSTFPLAFGSRKATLLDNLKSYVDLASETVPTLLAVDPILGSEHPFESSMCVVKIGSIEGLASSTTPMRFADRGSENCYIDIALMGEQSATIGKKELWWGRRKNIAYFAPEGRIEAVKSHRSNVLFKLDEKKVKLTASSMFMGLKEKFDSNVLSHSNVFPGAIEGASFINLFDNIFGIIDSCNLDPSLLKALPVENMIYRAFLHSVFPQYVSSYTYRLDRRHQKIDVICDRIVANPDKWLSATEMESLAGVSFRSITSSFQKRFGMTPMRWQRSEKLRFARQMLLKDEETSIKDIAKALGFPSSSAFSTYYREQFGELPRATRKSGWLCD